MKKLILKVLYEVFPRTWFRHASYSQDGEDMVLKAFYEGQKNYKGFYVDVGAHHPFRFSNTAYFYNKGWSGINIEPTPTLIGYFRKYRKRDINLNIGIAERQTDLTFYLFDEPALNSFDAGLSEHRHQTTGYKIIDKVTIKTQSLAEVFDKNLKPGQKIDFFTIDVEGLDLQVLKSNNWSKYIPDFILIEGDFDVRTILSDEIYSYLSDLNYEMVARTMRTSVYRLKK